MALSATNNAILKSIKGDDYAITTKNYPFEMNIDEEVSIMRISILNGNVNKI